MAIPAPESEGVGANQTAVPGRTLVEAFSIRGQHIIEPGYTLNFEMLLWNLSSQCRCVAIVDVVSARPLQSKTF